jgi:hypothetical protein
VCVAAFDLFLFAKVVNGSGIRSRDFDQIDVGAIQMKPENRGALFQVASNFNCLEFISSSDSARRGITKYVSDHTQGKNRFGFNQNKTKQKNKVLLQASAVLEPPCIETILCLTLSTGWSIEGSWTNKSACCKMFLCKNLVAHFLSHLVAGSQSRTDM